MLAVEFARFLGLPVTTRANITDVIEAVCGVLIDARVTVVCVDELHTLSLTTRNGAEVSDTLKYFSERIPATFVYAGVDLEAGGLFDGTRGRQIAGRFGVIETVPPPAPRNGPDWSPRSNRHCDCITTDAGRLKGWPTTSTTARAA